MNSAPEFHAYGCAHLTVIFLTVGLPFLLALIVHRTKSRFLERTICFAISALLLINYVAYLIVARNFGVTRWYKALPMQLCDWAMIVIIVALWTGNRRWLEVAYFWGIGGTLQAILTPNLRFGFPDVRFISFFVAHSGIIIGIVFLMLIYGFRPRAIGVLRGSAYRRELRFSSSQTGSRFASEFSVRFPAALPCPISRPGLSFLLRALRAICDCRSCAQTAKFSNGMKSFRVGKVTIGGKRPVFILGPCVIESEKFVWQMARSIAKICAAEDVDLIFKASYDKANRTSVRSFRGMGAREGCEILAAIGEELKIPVTTDVHSPDEAKLAGDMIDLLQIPAFLCRQTDLLKAAGQTGRAVNVKKGQFLAPWDVKNIAQKLMAFGCKKFCFTERGATFGYNNLVADMRSLYWMREAGYQVIFDATHSVQRPGGAGDKTSGDSALAPVLARAAMAAGCDGIFMEVHENPPRALSDAANQIPLKDLPKHLRMLKAIHAAVW